MTQLRVFCFGDSVGRGIVQEMVKTGELDIQCCLFDGLIRSNLVRAMCAVLGFSPPPEYILWISGSNESMIGNSIELQTQNARQEPIDAFTSGLMEIPETIFQAYSQRQLPLPSLVIILPYQLNVKEEWKRYVNGGKEIWVKIREQERTNMYREKLKQFADKEHFGVRSLYLDNDEDGTAEKIDAIHPSPQEYERASRKIVSLILQDHDTEKVSPSVPQLLL